MTTLWSVALLLGWSLVGVGMTTICPVVSKSDGLRRSAFHRGERSLFHPFNCLNGIYQFKTVVNVKFSFDVLPTHHSTIAYTVSIISGTSEFRT